MSSSRGTSQPVKIRTSSSGLATSSKLKVGSRVIICDDADLRGEISIGSGEQARTQRSLEISSLSDIDFYLCVHLSNLDLSGSVIHPKCVIHALSGPISIGSNCIIEELVTIINTSNEPMIIGDDNIFEVSSRVENVTIIGRGNTFEMKSQVMGYPSDEAGQAGELRIGDECTIAMGARLGPGMMGLGSTDSLEITQEALAELLLLDEPQDDEQAAIEATAGASSFDLGPVAEEGEDETTPSVPPPPPKTPPSRMSAQDLTLLNRSVIFGALAHRIHQTQRSGESLGQERALHAKHLEYLRESEYRPGEPL